MEMICHMFPLTSSWLQITEDDGDDGNRSEKKNEFDKILQTAQTHCKHLFLIGHGNVDITSLLFQGAVSCGTKTLTVVFICPHPLEKIPSGVHGMPKPEANTLQHVHFQYLKSIEELINYCASIHTRSVMPDVIMVDNLKHYLGQEKKGEHGLAKMCALLLDTVTFIGSKNERELCQLVVGSQECHDINPSILEKFQLSPVQIEGTPILNQFKLSSKMDSIEITVQYRVTEGAIFLQDVELTSNDRIHQQHKKPT